MQWPVQAKENINRPGGLGTDCHNHLVNEAFINETDLSERVRGEMEARTSTANQTPSTLNRSEPMKNGTDTSPGGGVCRAQWVTYEFDGNF